MKVPGEVVYFAVGLATYLVASIPFGFVTAKVVKGIDLRKVGSGNIGATNAARELGTAWFFPIFTLDFMKGFAPAFWVAPWIAARVPCPHCPHLAAMLVAFCGLMALAGHLYPVWLGFKGGKGVATAGGVIFAVNWAAGLGCLAVWLAAFLATRYISVGSVVTALLLPLVHMATAHHAGWIDESRIILLVLFSIFSLAVIIRHRGNIKRLIIGTEPRVRFSSR